MATLPVCKESTAVMLAGAMTGCWSASRFKYATALCSPQAAASPRKSV